MSTSPHAFDATPAICHHYEQMDAIPMGKMVGLSSSWAIVALKSGYTKKTEKLSFTPSDHYTLTLHISGASRRLDLNRYEGKTSTPGTLSLISPGSCSSFATDGPTEFIDFYFKQSLLCELGNELGLSHGSELKDFFSQSISWLVCDLNDYWQRAIDPLDPPSPLEMNSRAYLIGSGLLRYARVLSGQLSLTGSSSTRPELIKAVELMEERLADPIQVGDLADAVHLSPFHFSRLFRDAFNETPASYLMRRRTEKARELISNTDLPLSVIAYRTGFSSQSHMARRVKSVYGVTPRNLRKTSL